MTEMPSAAPTPAARCRNLGEKNWARSHAAGLVTPGQLVAAGLVDPSAAQTLEEVKDNFDIRIPEAFFPGLATGDQSLRVQCMPTTDELNFHPEELEDPIGDEKWTPVPGLTHRYPDRALLKVTYQCAVYCRFCFRRYKVSSAEESLSLDALEPAFAYLEQNPGIWEVILTGGDPLVLTDKRLEQVLERLRIIEHVKIVRFHTRIPTVLPSRVSEQLIQLLKGCGKTVWVVAHINSESELTTEARTSLGRLMGAGIPVLSQSVLLRGVNDTPEKLTALLRALVGLGVKPYYLHYPDLAQGTQHFRIPLERALSLVSSLRGTISGLCIPQLVVDIPSGFGKIIVEPQRARQVSENEWVFESPLDGTQLKVAYPVG